jgi:hypothetical protein
MADKELSRLSPEQVQKLAKAISDAKDLTYQQEEIINKVLAGEEKISEARISNLTKYFDMYSEKLDAIARKHSSLNDEFLILDKKLTENYGKLSSDIEELARRLTDLPNRDEEVPVTQSSGTTKSGGSGSSGLLSGILQEVRGIHQYITNNGVNPQTSSAPKDISSREAVINSISQPQPGQPAEVITSVSQTLEDDVRDRLLQTLDSIENYQTVSTDDRGKLGEARSSENILARLQAFETTEAQTEAILKRQENAVISIERLKDERLADRSQQAKDYARKEVQLEETLTELTMARLQERADREAQQRNLQIKHAQAMANAELTAQELRNQTNAEIVVASDADGAKALGNWRARTVNAEEDLKSQQEVAAQIVKYRQQLEDEARLRNKGKLTAEKAAEIEEQVAKEHEERLKSLAELTQKRFETEARVRELAKLSTEDPALAAERDARIAREIAELELQYRLNNNNVLDKDARDNIRAQVEDRYAYESDAIDKLAEEYTEKIKVDHLREAAPKAAAALESAKAKFIAEEEYKLRRQKHRLLTEDERKQIKDAANEKFKLSEENEKKLRKIQDREDKKAKRADIAATDQTIASATRFDGLSKEDNLASRIDSLVSIVGSVNKGDEGKAALAVAVKAISSMAAQLENKIDQIASYKGDIDTRLQGSNNKKASGSYWDQLSRDMMSVGAITPFFKQEDFANNIKSLVDTGIAFDLKQRAFLMTIQEKIANTFDVADSTLLRLVRLQQEDSTAGRLGMESMLNSFLNNMYENTEYLKTVAAGVRSSLEEMEALMSGAEATEVEYQVQKWMGSLYSVGMSQDAVQSIASTLGQLAAGQIDALTNGGGTGNLMVMAANKAGLAISDILTEGLDATETNNLLQATVNYLAELAESSKDSRVIQQQLASVYGVKASDLRAATNLATNDTVSNIYSQYSTYDNMLNQLNQMTGTMYQRTSLGEMMSNVWGNGQYTLAGSMANNPVSYLLYKAAGLLESTTGGIALPAISVAGFGVDLETTVADLMRVGSMAGGILGSIGPIVSGLASSFDGQAMLSTMGIESGSGLTITPRGTGLTANVPEGGGAQTTSGSGYVGNASGGDVKEATLQEAEDSKKQQMIEAKEEAEATQIDFINTNVLKIYELLDDVANGKRSFNVKVAGYGLTSLSGSAALTSAQGGVDGLLSNTPSTSSGSLLGSTITGGNTTTGGWDNTSAGTSVGSFGYSGDSSGFGSQKTIDFGNWTI